ncbi:hypothetical protein BBJ28_00017045 [Nothophytophthora sp. Chile5]|nr:hypothetical protein BBJ28_00017045 [Nothophytophthora sp. Chile5]
MVLHLCLLLAALVTVQAWTPGSQGRAQWDYECRFQGQELRSVQQEPSSNCADLCLAQEACSHWSWTAVDDGTCWLKQGTSNAVSPHASNMCGFLPSRFALDETQAFDLDLELEEEGEYDGLTDAEAETALLLLNSFRSKRRKPKLTLDARLILAAHELSATCRDVPFTDSMRDGDGYELLPKLPAVLTYRGFEGQVHAVSVAAAPHSSVKHAIEWWTSGADAETGAKPFFSDDVAVVGFAKRNMSSCSSSRTSRGSASSGVAVVWTLLLAQTV